MPIYRNITQQPVTIAFGFHSQIIMPFKTYESEVIVNDPRLQVVDVYPSYNPVSKHDEFLGQVANDVVEVELETNTLEFLLQPTSIIQVYMNDIANDPPLKILGNPTALTVSQRIKKIYIKFVTGGDVLVTQFKDNIMTG